MLPAGSWRAFRDKSSWLLFVKRVVGFGGFGVQVTVWAVTGDDVRKCVFELLQGPVIRLGQQDQIVDLFLAST